VEAGERLLHTQGSRIEEIDAELAALSELREKPVGAIRITVVQYAVDALPWPKLTKLLRLYPDIKVEISIDSGLTGLISEVTRVAAICRCHTSLGVGPVQRRSRCSAANEVVDQHVGWNRSMRGNIE